MAVKKERVEYHFLLTEKTLEFVEAESLLALYNAIKTVSLFAAYHPAKNGAPGCADVPEHIHIVSCVSRGTKNQKYQQTQEKIKRKVKCKKGFTVHLSQVCNELPTTQKSRVQWARDLVCHANCKTNSFEAVSSAKLQLKVPKDEWLDTNCFRNVTLDVKRVAGVVPDEVHAFLDDDLEDDEENGDSCALDRLLDENGRPLKKESKWDILANIINNSGVTNVLSLQRTFQMEHFK